MGRDLSQANLSTVGSSAYIFICHQSSERNATVQDELVCCRRLHNSDDSFHAITCVVLRFAFDLDVGTGTRDYILFIPLRLVTQ